VRRRQLNSDIVRAAQPGQAAETKRVQLFGLLKLKQAFVSPYAQSVMCLIQKVIL